MPSNAENFVALGMPYELAKQVGKALGDSSGTTVGLSGSFVASGATPVVVPNVNLAAGDFVGIMLVTPGGTVGAMPAIVTRTNGTGFNVVATAGDTSTYGYRIYKA